MTNLPDRAEILGQAKILRETFVWADPEPTDDAYRGKFRGASFELMRMGGAAFGEYTCTYSLMLRGKRAGREALATVFKQAFGLPRFDWPAIKFRSQVIDWPEHQVREAILDANIENQATTEGLANAA